MNDHTGNVLNNSKKTTILGGAGCAGAHNELIELGGQAEGSHRARFARERVHRVRQPVRCWHDRAARIFLWLSRDDELRRVADDWDGFSLSAVFSKGCNHRSN